MGKSTDEGEYVQVDCKRMVYLFILCTTRFLTLATEPIPFVDNIENLESYPWRTNVYEELPVQISRGVGIMLEKPDLNQGGDSSG